ncbi:MAG: hypothetical protein GYA12_12015 [Chloroflexi bacterium]|nr:hypothetical protein [Chloroflexota bacterium]
MNEEPFWDLDAEIDTAFRSAPLVHPPAGLYAGIMKQVRAASAVPEFHLKWTDFAVSLLGSFSVAIFLASFVFMPEPLRARAQFMLQWMDYLSRVSLIWVLPVISAVIILAAAGFSVTCSARLFK